MLVVPPDDGMYAVMWSGITSSSTPTCSSRPSLSEGGAARAVLRLCLRGEAVPLIGQALFTEYEDVFARPEPFARSPLPRGERDALLDAFLAVCR